MYIVPVQIRILEVNMPIQTTYTNARSQFAWIRVLLPIITILPQSMSPSTLPIPKSCDPDSLLNLTFVFGKPLSPVAEFQYLRLEMVA